MENGRYKGLLGFGNLSAFPCNLAFLQSSITPAPHAQNRGRAKELERQLEEQKAMFARRVRDLEAKLRVCGFGDNLCNRSSCVAGHAPTTAHGRACSSGAYSRLQALCRTWNVT